MGGSKEEEKDVYKGAKVSEEIGEHRKRGRNREQRVIGRK